MSRTRVGLRHFQASIVNLSLEQQRSLYAWLAEVIENTESLEEEMAALPTKPGRRVVETQRVGQVVYRRESVCCGKDNCKCASGELHGPYYYAYQRQQGRLKSWYVGKQLPDKGKE